MLAGGSSLNSEQSYQLPNIKQRDIWRDCLLVRWVHTQASSAGAAGMVYEMLANAKTLGPMSAAGHAAAQEVRVVFVISRWSRETRLLKNVAVQTFRVRRSRGRAPMIQHMAKASLSCGVLLVRASDPRSIPYSDVPLGTLEDAGHMHGFRARKVQPVVKRGSELAG